MGIKLHNLLLNVTSTLNKKLFVELAGTGLTSGQPKVLDFLKEHDGCEQKDIASACEIESSTVTSLLLGMERFGLVEKRMLNGNRRSLHVFLTDKGRSSQRIVSNAFEKLEKSAFQGFSEEEQEDFLEKFQRIYHNLSGEKN